jgi:asparagine synthase (glutamine-hydrolysing)
MYHETLTISNKNIEIELVDNYGKWVEDTNGCLICGIAFFEDDDINPPYKNTQIFTILLSALQNDSIIKKLSQLNGFFSLVMRTEKELLIAVDHVRSRPLFVAQVSTDKIFITDSFYRAQMIVGATSYCNKTIEQFRCTGYTLGNDTLVSGIKQIQAGELLRVKEDKIIFERYWRYSPVPKIDESRSVLLQQLNNAVVSSIQHLIKIANGRQIVIPLSGGYDSRLILLKLAEAGYSNIITFTFGSKQSKEIPTSKYVAETLGFKWICIPYTNAMWKSIFKSEEFQSYLRFIHSGVSVPNIVIWPAIRELMEKKLIKSDAVVVPGHIISGSYVPRALVDIKKGSKAIDNKSIADMILSKHFNLSEKTPIEISNEITNWVSENSIHHNKLENKMFLGASIFEEWEWQERQAKFTCNSNRYFDYFKLDWWMPLWDKHFTNFWSSVPYAFKFQKVLLKFYVDHEWVKNTNQSLPNQNRTIMDKIIGRINRYLSFWLEPNRLYGFISFHYWLLCMMSRKRRNIPMHFAYLCEFLTNQKNSEIKNGKR